MTFWFANISTASPLIAILLGTIYYKNLSSTLRIVFLIMLLSFASDIISLVVSNRIGNNLPIIHGWALVDGILIFLFFIKLLPRYKNFTIVLLTIFVVFYLTDSWMITGIYKFNGYSRSIEALMVMLLCVLYFYHLYETEQDIFVDRQPEFWIVVALLVYFSGALFSFLLSVEIFSQSPERFYGSWILHNSANILKNLLLTLALWKARPSPTSN